MRELIILMWPFILYVSKVVATVMVDYSLFLAVEMGHVEIARTLMLAGANRFSYFKVGGGFF